MAAHALTADASPSHSRLRAKAAGLARLHAAGVPVPEAYAFDIGPAGEIADLGPAQALVATGPVIVRSALAGEDESDVSAAGLGRSVPDVRGLAALHEALASVVAHGLHGRAAVGQVIVQRFVAGRRRLVAIACGGHVDVQVHDGDPEAVGAGVSALYVGSLAGWDDPAREAVGLVVARAVTGLPPSRFGHDLELVVTARDEVFAVQARPLVAPLWPDAPALLSLAREIDPSLSLAGRWTLDAEHNPAPLSPAHGWLLRHLAARRADAGNPTSVAGWLYVQTLPRSLAGASHATVLDPVAALRALATEHLPAGRARLRRVVDDASAGRHDAAFDGALAAFDAMIDAYLDVLVPSRVAARRAGLRPIPDATDPLSLRGRAAFADVLPATWDVASPTLADLGWEDGADERVATTLPDDPAVAATLLAEWDDHLFALGLAPLRRALLAEGARRGLADDDAFFVTPPRLRGDAPTAALAEEIARARAWQARAAALRPPFALEDGRAVAATPSQALRGHPIGPTARGRLAIRRDLAHLLAAPLRDDEVLAIPALTAPAAVALHASGARALVCEHGGPLSHAALMARELGLTALIGCRGCTELPDGTDVTVDTRTGRLRPANKA